MTRYLITSALPYVNNVPHLGTLIGCVLSADVFARFCRLRGRETMYICGTDEYGTATQARAIEEGLTPKQVCDKYFVQHKAVYDWFGISTDYFGRTSDKAHIQHTQDIFLSLYKAGMLQEREVEQPYDPKLGLFLADRFVVGTCPHCGSTDARSDQCDKCGKLLTYAELGAPHSKLSGVPPVLRKSKHLFLSLDRCQGKLEAWIDGIEREGRWSANTIAIARSWLKEGLRERSITRDLEWGVPVPLPGWEGKVLYVWFDAPIGYITFSAERTPDWKSWWLGPTTPGPDAIGAGAPDVRHYEFIGKDNVPFHAIIFPAMLLGTGQDWTLPYYISSTEFLNYEDGKFSKSKGVGVFGNDAMESGLPADVWRYYLLATRPESADATFSWDEFGSRTNKELLGNWGNLVNRTLVFLAQNYGGKVPQPGALSEQDRAFLADVKARLDKTGELLDGVQLRAALAEFMGAASAANAYLQAQAPWKSVREDPVRAGTALYCLANAIDALAIAAEPFLPASAASVRRQMNQPTGKWEDIGQWRVCAGHALGKPEHLYKPVDAKAIAMYRQKYAGHQKKEGAQAAKTGAQGAGAPVANAGQKTGAGTNSGASTGAKMGGAVPQAPAAPKAPAQPPAKLKLEELQLEVGLIQSVERHPNAEKLYVERILMARGEVRTICSGLVPYMKEEQLLNHTCLVVKNLKPAKLRGVESAGMVLVAEEEGEEGALELISPQAPAGTPIRFEGITPGAERPITIDEFGTVELTIQNGQVYADGHALGAEGKPLRTQTVQEGVVN